MCTNFANAERGLRGEIVEFFHVRNIGMNHRDDAYDVTFDQESIVVEAIAN